MEQIRRAKENLNMSKRWVLLRGLSRGNNHWGELPKLLQEQGLEVELIEIPGNGTRYKETTPLSSLKVIESIKKKSQFAKEQKTFNICGISLGGMLALKWAQMYPDEVEHVVIINSSLSQLSPVHHRISLRSIVKILRGLTSKDPMERESITLSLTVNNEEVRKQYLKSFARLSQKNPISAQNFLRQLYLATRIKVNQSLTLQVPVTIIVSIKDHFVSPSCSFEMARFFGVNPISHPTSGHDLPLEAPEWLLKILTQLSKVKSKAE